jgi:DNA-binding transcriptional LysR family regulator
MDKLRSIRVFIEVARGLSFSAAAQRMGMARGTVSKHVAWLEQSLGTRLLTRTTKSVALTEAGLSLLEYGPDLLERVESVDAAVLSYAQGPKGVLRVGTPPAFGAVHLTPVATAFSEQHRDIQIELYFDDGRSDLVMEGLDVSIRIAASLKDTSQVAYLLAATPQLLVASPSYLEQYGMPHSIADLVHHNCMVHILMSPTSLWTFDGPDGKISVKVNGNIRSNFGESLRQATLLGHGIALNPTYMVADDLREGRLEVLLPQYRPVALNIYAVIQGRKHLPLRVRLFLIFLIAHFRSPSWEVSDDDLSSDGSLRNAGGVDGVGGVDGDGSEAGDATPTRTSPPGPADTPGAALS